MKTYNFSLIISKPSVSKEEAADALYAKCNDATFSVSNGLYELEFDRKAWSYKSAVKSAKRDVLNSGIGSHIIETIKDDTMDRFQYQPWHVKLWRRRYYITVPLDAWRMYWSSKRAKEWDCDPLSWHNAWSIAVGSANVKMNWVYSSKEVFERLGWHSWDEDREEDNDET